MLYRPPAGDGCHGQLTVMERLRVQFVEHRKTKQLYPQSVEARRLARRIGLSSVFSIFSMRLNLIGFLDVRGIER